MTDARVPLLETHEVVAGYLPGVDILTGVDLALHDGEIVGVVGPNGAGKSTLIKALFGLVPVRGGDVLLRGERITNRPAHELVRRGIGYVPQRDNVFASLTVEDNLRMGGFQRPHDFGARFEHVAALAYGRLGVPGPSRVVTRTKLREFFVGSDEKSIGLAQWVATQFFSPGTLPEETRIGTSGKVKVELARPQPTIDPKEIHIMAAGQPGGTTLENDRKVCLARYAVDAGEMSFFLDDECMLEQVSVILPEVVAYETGLLDWLFRGQLEVTVAKARAQIAAKGLGLGAGEVELLAEDARGVRTSLGRVWAEDIGGGRNSIQAEVAGGFGIDSLVFDYLLNGVLVARSPALPVGTPRSTLLTSAGTTDLGPESVHATREGGVVVIGTDYRSEGLSGGGAPGACPPLAGCSCYASSSPGARATPQA